MVRCISIIQAVESIIGEVFDDVSFDEFEEDAIVSFGWSVCNQTLANRVAIVVNLRGLKLIVTEMGVP